MQQKIFPRESSEVASEKGRVVSGVNGFVAEMREQSLLV